MEENRDCCDQELAEHMAASLGEFIPLTGMEQFKKSKSIQLALVQLMDKSGYDILQVNGQRKYGGPPPDWEGPAPRIDCEVFVGKIPRDMYEDELVPLFETAGTIYEMRLMMEFSGENRGYAFVMEEARKAIEKLNEHEVRPGKFIGVCASLNKCSLFLDCIPKDKSKEEILEEVKEITEGLLDVTVLPSYRGKNRGFAFLEYETHKAAAFARKDLMARMKLWGKTIRVNWAKLDKHRKGENMQNIKIAHVRNLSPSTTEETLQREFERFKPGAVVRVKKFTHHAFVHFDCHKDAIAATKLMNGTTIDGTVVEVSLDKSGWEGVVRRSDSEDCHGSKAGGGSRGLVVPHGAGMNERSAVESMNTSPHYQRSPQCGGGSVEANRRVFPLIPGSRLYCTSLRLLRPAQFRSAVSLLELYCCINNLPPPHYELFSMLGPGGSLLLVYKVVMLLTQQAFIPDNLCVQLDDAKELAAQNTLWNLETSFMNDLSRSTSPAQSATTSPDLLW
ncbi:probable RNA-binding protein 46 isoform X2 [Phyllopteryx taeniolatus]|uniref:probable RNA-binding protein 46 isoform X2 n=1 Tax=Phyllopteryx taeniolatus TaxID=161469 RepID=UPI002AD1D4A9|nr:probable RNA-binding protein 46 isoform X2 [Phyllopteryx taeniolatus]